MTVSNLDHVTIRTANLTGLSRFYREVLGLEDGPRPGFNFGGAWLYCGGSAALHLVEVTDQPEVPAPQIEHFAFRADGLAEFLEKLRRHEVAYRVALVPGNGNKQVHIHDPDRNHVEVQFDAGEEAELATYDGGNSSASKA